LHQDLITIAATIGLVYWLKLMERLWGNERPPRQHLNGTLDFADDGTLDFVDARKKLSRETPFEFCSDRHP